MNKLYKPTYQHDDVQILEKSHICKGHHLNIVQYQLQHRLFAGGMSPPIIREVLQRNLVVAGLLYDPSLDKVVMIEQFRIGALASQQPWLLEIVAGIMVADEQPLHVLRREVLEETNLEFKAYMPIYEYWSSPGCSTEKVFLYCVQIDAKAAGGIFGLAHEGEDIQVRVLTLEQLETMLQQGKIVNGLALLALQWLLLNRSKVKHAWGYGVSSE